MASYIGESIEKTNHATWDPSIVVKEEHITPYESEELSVTTDRYRAVDVDLVKKEGIIVKAEDEDVCSWLFNSRGTALLMQSDHHYNQQNMEARKKQKEPLYSSKADNDTISERVDRDEEKFMIKPEMNQACESNRISSKASKAVFLKGSSEYLQKVGVSSDPQNLYNTTEHKRLRQRKTRECTACDMMHSCPRGNATKRKHACTGRKKSSTKNSNLVNNHPAHSGEKRYPCEICGKYFSSPLSKLEHSRVHPREKPHTCKVCGKSFALKSALAIHHRIHTGEKPYACKVCGKRFSDSASLGPHNRTHTGEKPYSCTMCDKSFSGKTGLRNHINTHTGIKRCACQVCGKLFSAKCCLIVHNRIHTGEKPFTCTFCGKSFTKKYNLTVHNRLHTGEKPYPCAMCGESFVTKERLKQHEVIHTGEKTHVCNVCGKSFSRKHNLFLHGWIHTGENPYLCSTCGKTFSTFNNFKAHCKTHSDDKKSSP